MKRVYLDATVATETIALATSPHCVDATNSFDALPYDNATAKPTNTICNRCEPVSENFSLRGVEGSILMVERRLTRVFALLYSEGIHMEEGENMKGGGRGGGV